jgi:outer membrane protein assembly factor BamB
VDVTTWHNDVQRTGQNLQETMLTPASVTASNFGKVHFLAADGKVDAMPLYLSSVTLGGQARNVVFVATEHGSVYAFDADQGTQLWKVSILGSGETPSDDHGCYQISPEIGVTSTPVIDRKAGENGTIYIVSMSKDAGGHYHQRLHAMDVTTGGELLRGPTEISASYPTSGGMAVFDPGQYAERAALLLLNGIIYTAWTSHCDYSPYQGWIIGYDASTLKRSSVLNLTPNGSEGSIWMSGAGMAADASGNIYFLDANGTFDTTLDSNGFPSNNDFGNAFLKVSTSGILAVTDYFATFDTAQQSQEDSDLGSGGALVLPDQTDSSGQKRQLVVGAGKDGNVYVLDRNNMGKFDTSKNNIYQQLSNALVGGVFGAPAYFNGTLYYGAVGQTLKAFPVQWTVLASSPSSQSSMKFTYPGTTPSVSANGASGGIVWAVENGASTVLHAFDVVDLSHELYNSNQAGMRDSFGAGNKFITPMIAGGKVFVGTPNGVAVFGLLK